MGDLINSYVLVSVQALWVLSIFLVSKNGLTANDLSTAVRK
jgi:hypothetical protein